MADDHSQRPYRSSESIARTGQARGAPPAAGSDPLAELARLIGQTDPFGDLGKEPRRTPAPQPEPAMDWKAPPPQSFAPHEPAPPVAPHDYPRDYPPQSAPQYGEPPRFDQAAYSQPQGTGLYDVEQGVPAYLTQRSQAPGYDQHGFQPGEPDDGYDDVPPRRRIGVMAIAGIFALAVVGTAGAFGYRAVFGGSGSHVPPPVIKADTAPSKIVPESTKDSSKLITERVGGEKIVSREEKPVDLKDKIATPVFPPVTGTAGSNGQGGMVGNGLISGSEPKKVRTVVIRPDQMVADAGNAAPVAAPPAAPPPMAMPDPQTPRAAAPPLAPARTQQPAEVTHAAPAPHAPPPQPARSANAPLSLSPNDAPAAPAPAPHAPTRTASTAPTSLAPSGNAASVARGGYAVQVSSQRSEGDAQTAYRALQAKYASVLGGHGMFVHRVDLGAKGTYYRAMVGPFASQAEAVRLCTSLKSAGGSCLIQRN